MTDIFGIHWANLDYFISFPIFLFFIVLIIQNHRRSKKTFRRLVHPKNLGLVFKHFSIKRQLVKAVLLICSLVFIFFALLQPQWGKVNQVVTQEGRDLLIVLDISRSMKAKDFKPTRLDFAKLKIRNLLSKLTCERVGLIIFSGEAFAQCPMTIDHSAFLMFLEDVDTETISSGTTAIDKALGKALKVFSSSPERKNKLMFLLTDGEDFSINLNTQQNKALQENLHLFALGVGSPDGAPIPKFDFSGKQIGHETDEKGNIILSKLNENMLQQLCSKLEGHYLKATYDDSDLNTLVSYITSYEKEKFTDKKLSLFQDQYPWFLTIAWLCLALEWIL